MNYKSLAEIDLTEYVGDGVPTITINILSTDQPLPFRRIDWELDGYACNYGIMLNLKTKLATPRLS